MPLRCCRTSPYFFNAGLFTTGEALTKWLDLLVQHSPWMAVGCRFSDPKKNISSLVIVPRDHWPQTPRLGEFYADAIVASGVEPLVKKRVTPAVFYGITGQWQAGCGQKHGLERGKIFGKAGSLFPCSEKIAKLGTSTPDPFRVAGRCSTKRALLALRFDCLFGPAYKGIPLAAAVAIALYKNHGISAATPTRKREREREEQFARLSHACSASEASTVKTALGSKQEFPLLWTACLPWFQFLFSGPHTFMPDEKSMQILLTFASLLMDFCSGGRNVAYAYNRKEAKAGVARYTGTSDLHFGMATSTETTHAIVAPTCVNNFDLLVCHMTYCHILSHIVTYCHILSHWMWHTFRKVRPGFSASRGIEVLST